MAGIVSEFDHHIRPLGLYREQGRNMSRLTLAGSRPTTTGVHPIPVPKTILVKAFTVLVLPELAGPTTMTLGPLVIP